MGLAALLLGEQNPFAQWASQNSGALGALGAGMASGPDLATGLATGLRYMPQARQDDLLRAEKQKAEALQVSQTNATRTWLEKNRPDLLPGLDMGLSPADLWSQAMQQQSGGASLPASVQEYEYAVQNGYDGSFMDWQSRDKGAGNRPALGTTIYTGRDANGNIVPMQAGQGEFVPTQMPEGITFDPGGMAGARTGATVDAKTAGAARAALPGAEIAYMNTQNAIAELRQNQKGMNEWFSQWGPRGVYVNPGSEMGKFYAAAEPTNNQAFMQAREALKGGGQITDFEGRKAEDAFSRMRAAMEKGDQEQYLRALADFEDAVAQGFRKLQEKAQGGYSAPVPGQTAPGNSGDGWSVIGVE